MENPLIVVGALVLVGYFFRLWLQDYRAYCATAQAAAAESPAADPSTEQTATLTYGALPGTTPVGMTAIVIAIVGALAILGAEVAGEYRLGVVQEQTEMTVLFGIYTLAAAFVEELIFRGFLYYDKGSRLLLLVSVVLISAAFALLHPYIWKYEVPPETYWIEVHRCLSLDLSTKPIFSTVIVFLNSLWFYYVRFFRLNPLRSLIPCFAAHLSSNLGVFVIKAIQGKVLAIY